MVTALYMENFDEASPTEPRNSQTVSTHTKTYSEPVNIPKEASSSIRRKQKAIYKIANGKPAAAAQHYVQNKSTAYNMNRNLPTKLGKFKTMLHAVSFVKKNSYGYVV